MVSRGNFTQADIGGSISPSQSRPGAAAARVIRPVATISDPFAQYCLHLSSIIAGSGTFIDSNPNRQTLKASALVPQLPSAALKALCQVSLAKFTADVVARLQAKTRQECAVEVQRSVAPIMESFPAKELLPPALRVKFPTGFFKSDAAKQLYGTACVAWRQAVLRAVTADALQKVEDIDISCRDLIVAAVDDVLKRLTAVKSPVGVVNDMVLTAHAAQRAVAGADITDLHAEQVSLLAAAHTLPLMPPPPQFSPPSGLVVAMNAAASEVAHHALRAGAAPDVAAAAAAHAAQTSVSAAVSAACDAASAGGAAAGIDAAAIAGEAASVAAQVGAAATAAATASIARGALATRALMTIFTAQVLVTQVAVLFRSRLQALTAQRRQQERITRLQSRFQVDDAGADGDARARPAHVEPHLRFYAVEGAPAGPAQVQRAAGARPVPANTGRSDQRPRRQQRRYPQGRRDGRTPQRSRSRSNGSGRARPQRRGPPSRGRPVVRFQEQQRPSTPTSTSSCIRSRASSRSRSRSTRPFASSYGSAARRGPRDRRSGRMTSADGLARRAPGGLRPPRGRQPNGGPRRTQVPRRPGVRPGGRPGPARAGSTEAWGQMLSGSASASGFGTARVRPRSQDDPDPRAPPRRRSGGSAGAAGLSADE